MTTAAPSLGLYNRLIWYRLRSGRAWKRWRGGSRLTGPDYRNSRGGPADGGSLNHVEMLLRISVLTTDGSAPVSSPPIGRTDNTSQPSMAGSGKPSTFATQRRTPRPRPQDRPLATYQPALPYGRDTAGPHRRLDPGCRLRASRRGGGQGGALPRPPPR